MFLVRRLTYLSIWAASVHGIYVLWTVQTNSDTVAENLSIKAKRISS